VTSERSRPVSGNRDNGYRGVVGFHECGQEVNGCSSGGDYDCHWLALYFRQPESKKPSLTFIDTDMQPTEPGMVSARCRPS
jgi:hypothetical protein